SLGPKKSSCNRRSILPPCMRRAGCFAITTSRSRASSKRVEKSPGDSKKSTEPLLRRCECTSRPNHNRRRQEDFSRKPSSHLPANEVLPQKVLSVEKMSNQETQQGAPGNI